MDNNRLFPLDRIRYLDLEVVRLDGKNIAFNAGYYYVPFKKKGQSIEYKKIENSFRVGFEKVEKKFELPVSEDPKHFYFKVELGSKLGELNKLDEKSEGSMEYLYSLYNTILYDIKSISIVDDEVSKKYGYIYPYYETMLDAESTKLKVNKFKNGEITKEEDSYVNTPNNKNTKIFYIYFCSLSFGLKDDSNKSPTVDEMLDVILWRFQSRENNDPKNTNSLKKWKTCDWINKLSEKQREEVKLSYKKVDPNFNKNLIGLSQTSYGEVGFFYEDHVGELTRYDRKRNGDMNSFSVIRDGHSFLSPFMIIGYGSLVKTMYNPSIPDEVHEDPPDDGDEKNQSLEDKADEIDRGNSEEPSGPDNPWGDLDWMDQDWSDYEAPPPWSDVPDGPNPIWDDQPDAGNPLWDNSDWLN